MAQQEEEDIFLKKLNEDPEIKKIDIMIYIHSILKCPSSIQKDHFKEVGQKIKSNPESNPELKPFFSKYFIYSVITILTTKLMIEKSDFSTPSSTSSAASSASASSTASSESASSTSKNSYSFLESVISAFPECYGTILYENGYEDYFQTLFYSAFIIFIGLIKSEVVPSPIIELFEKEKRSIFPTNFFGDPFSHKSQTEQKEVIEEIIENSANFLYRFVKTNKLFKSEDLPGLSDLVNQRIEEKKTPMKNEDNLDELKQKLDELLALKLENTLFEHLLDHDNSARTPPISVLAKHKLGKIIDFFPPNESGNGTIPILIPYNYYNQNLFIDDDHKKIDKKNFYFKVFTKQFFNPGQSDSSQSPANKKTLYSYPTFNGEVPWSQYDIFPFAYYHSGKESQLQPIQAHLLRLLYNFKERDSSFLKLNGGEDFQRYMTLFSLTSILFPYCNYSKYVSETTKKEEGFLMYQYTVKFVIDILSKFKEKYLFKLNNNKFSEIEATYAFQIAIDEIISMPEVNSLINPIKIPWINPKFLERQLLLDPVLQKKIPVIDTFLRFYEGFENVKYIPFLSRPIARLLSYSSSEYSNPYDFISQITVLDDIPEKSMKFQYFFASPVYTLMQDYISDSFRNNLVSVITDQSTYRMICPSDLTENSYNEWNILNVLLLCSQANNEFVTTLQNSQLQYDVSFSINTISDLDISNPNSVMINSQQLFAILLSIIAQDNSFDENGYPILKEKHEEQFIKKIETIPFNLILHNSLLSSKSQLPFIIDKFNNSLFMFLSKKIRKPKPLSYKQRFIYLEDLKLKNLLPTLKNVILLCLDYYQQNNNIISLDGSQTLIKYFTDCISKIKEKEELEIIVKALEKNNEDFKITNSDDEFKLNQIYDIYQAIVENSYETPNDKMNKAKFYLDTFEEIDENLNPSKIFKEQNINLETLKKTIADFILKKRNDPINTFPQILSYLNLSFDQSIEQYLKEKFANLDENYILIKDQYIKSKKELLAVCSFLDEEFTNVQFQKEYKIKLQDKVISVFEELREKDKIFDPKTLQKNLNNYYNLLDNINQSKKEDNLKDEEFLNDLKLMIGNCINNLHLIMESLNTNGQMLSLLSSSKDIKDIINKLKNLLIKLNEYSLQNEIDEIDKKIIVQVQNKDDDQQNVDDDQQNVDDDQQNVDDDQQNEEE